MDETIIPTPAVAKDTRMLATRRRASPVVVPLEKVASNALHEAPAVPTPPPDVHAECRARERALVEELRSELEAATARELDAARESARAEGREQGIEEGRAESLAAARAAAAEQLVRFDALLEALRERHEVALVSPCERAVELGFAAACRILGEKIVSGEGLRGIVEQLLARARAAERVTVRLHGDDLASLRERGAADDLAAERQVDFVEDATLARGDCCVDTGAGTLEARLASQIESLRDALLAAHRAGLAAGARE